MKKKNREGEWGRKKGNKRLIFKRWTTFVVFLTQTVGAKFVHLSVIFACTIVPLLTYLTSLTVKISPGSVDCFTVILCPTGVALVPFTEIDATLRQVIAPSFDDAFLGRRQKFPPTWIFSHPIRRTRTRIRVWLWLAQGKKVIIRKKIIDPYNRYRRIKVLKEQWLACFDACNAQAAQAGQKQDCEGMLDTGHFEEAGESVDRLVAVMGVTLK